MTPAMTFSVLLACVIIPFVTSACPNLPGTNGNGAVTVYWTFDWRTYTCPNITIVGDNPCIKLKCDVETRTVRLDGPMTCGPDCSTEPRTAGDCGQQYQCVGGIYDEIAEWYYTDWYHYRHGWFSVFSGYTCGNTGSGPCESDQCYNPFVDPKSEESACVEVGDTVYNNLTQGFQCQELTDCQGNAYPDLAQIQTGCTYEGQMVSELTVVASDACNETVCVAVDGVGMIVSRFKGNAGCVYQDQCVGVDATISGVVGYVCADLTCRYNSTLSNPYNMQHQADTGCFRDGQCYQSGSKLPVDGQCKFLKCKSKADTGTHFWDYKYTGCYDPFTNQCMYTDAYTDVIEGCVKRICDVTDYGKWAGWYKSTKSCVPDSSECNLSDGTPGCLHEDKCYPVKSILDWDGCSQYVCYSDDAGFMESSYAQATNRPEWRARALGCYSPKGCMKFGSQWLDPVTLNTYRCDFKTDDWGTKNVQFHQACVAPDGTILKLGDSVKVGTIWYSCYRWGKMKNPIDTSIVFEPEEDNNRTCGVNPDTGAVLYKKEYYYTPVARCKQLNYVCEPQCDYYDQPCTHLDLPPNQWRWLGDTFTLNNQECVCTQDYDINNKPIPNSGSLFDTPSLCSQDGVVGGACNDTSDGSVHQWRELWTRPGSDPIEICGCHPLLHQQVCSTSLPDVISATSDMKI